MQPPGVGVQGFLVGGAGGGGEDRRYRVLCEVPCAYDRSHDGHDGEAKRATKDGAPGTLPGALHGRAHVGGERHHCKPDGARRQSCEDRRVLDSVCARFPGQDRCSAEAMFGASVSAESPMAGGVSPVTLLDIVIQTTDSVCASVPLVPLPGLLRRRTHIGPSATTANLWQAVSVL